MKQDNYRNSLTGCFLDFTSCNQQSGIYPAKGPVRTTQHQYLREITLYSDKLGVRATILSLFFFMMSNLLYAQNILRDDPGNLDQLTKDTKKILQLLALENEIPELEVELDKLVVLKSIRELDYVNLQCTYITNPPHQEFKKLDEGNSFLLSSNDPVLSKVGINLIHLKTIKGRTIYAKGMIDGDDVYFKVHIDKQNKVNVTYIPISSEHIPRAIIVQESEATTSTTRTEEERFTSNSNVQNNRLRTQIADSETNTTITIEGDGDDGRVKYRLSNDKDTASIELDGALREGEDGTLATNLSLSDEDGNNEVYARAIIISENEPLVERVGYRYRQENLEVNIENSGETTNVRVKADKEIKRVSLGTELHADGETLNSTARAKYTSKDKKGNLQTEVRLKDDHVQRYSLSGSRKIGDNTTVNGGVTTHDSGKTILKAKVVHQFRDDKSRITASTDIIFQENTPEVIKPTVGYERDLNDSGKLKLRASKNAEIRDGDVIKLTGRAEVISNNDRGSVSVYIEGSMNPQDRDRDAEVGAGIRFSHDMGSDGSHLKLLKVHKLYKVLNKNGSQVGYYFTWRYECDVKKKKIRIHKQKKPIFGKVNLDGLFSLALPMNAQMPNNVYSPEGVPLSTFCK